MSRPSVHASRRRFLAVVCTLLSFGPVLRAADGTLLPLAAARRDATEVMAVITAAIGAPDATHPSLGAALATYAKHAGTAPARYEGFEEAARRIVAGRAAEKIAPDATSRRLDALASSLLETLRIIETTRADLRPPGFEADAPALRAAAHLARFHSRRILAAVHYNLFLRGQRLAELYAATMDAKTSVETWRELIAVVGDHGTVTLGATPITLSGAWREELSKLEFDFKDLEAMCCPPDDAMLREKVWEPLPPPVR